MWSLDIEVREEHLATGRSHKEVMAKLRNDAVSVPLGIEDNRLYSIQETHSAVSVPSRAFWITRT